MRQMDPTRTSVNEVHNEICMRAAEIANAEPSKHPQFFFQPLAVASKQTRSGTDGLMLEWDPDQKLSGRPSEEQEWLLSIMDGIAKDAIAQALREKAHLLVGLILGEARKSRNYFDLFSTDASANTH